MCRHPTHISSYMQAHPFHTPSLLHCSQTSPRFGTLYTCLKALFVQSYSVSQHTHIPSREAASHIDGSKMYTQEGASNGS